MHRLTILIPALAIALLAGCKQQQHEGVGPAQQAGKAIDDAGARVVNKVQEQVQKVDAAAVQARARVEDATEDASRNLDHATEAVGKKVEQAGEKIQQAAH